MPILATPKRHFDEDMARATDLMTHAIGTDDGRLKDDIFRSAWMMAVGATDAYFCDAYADLTTRVLQAKDHQGSIQLPDKFGNLLVPVIAVVGEEGGWRWRMAARQLIERQSVLSLKEIKALLRRFCRAQNNLLVESTIESWIQHPDATKRLWGVTARNYRALTADDKKKARALALKHLERRIDGVFQRRHDCIHNCDRPRVALQSISVGYIRSAILDLTFMVERIHAHLVDEFPEYLSEMGANAITRNQVGA